MKIHKSFYILIDKIRMKIKNKQRGGENFQVVLSVTENDANSHEVCCCIHIFKKEVFVASFLLLYDRR